MVKRKMSVKNLRAKFDEFLNTSFVKRAKKLLITKDFYIFLIFLLMATAFWFFNALRGEYVTTFSYPVRFVNVPENHVVVGGANQKIELKVKSNGYAILRQRISSRFIPVNYDVSSMRTIIRDGKSVSYMLSRSQINNVRNQLMVGMELADISPDTLFLHVDRVKKKAIPVRLEGKPVFEKQFILANTIVFEPESVTVTGPASLVDTISEIYTKLLETEALSDTFIKKIELKPIDNVKLSDNVVTLTIPVERYTEKMVNVPISVKGLPDSLWLKTFPSSLEVTFRAGMSKVETINGGDFSAVVDAAEILQTDRAKRLRVRIDKSPENIESFDYAPLFVEYVLELRNSN